MKRRHLGGLLLAASLLLASCDDNSSSEPSSSPSEEPSSSSSVDSSPQQLADGTYRVIIDYENASSYLPSENLEEELTVSYTISDGTVEEEVEVTWPVNSHVATSYLEIGVPAQSEVILTAPSYSVISYLEIDFWQYVNIDVYEGNGTSKTAVTAETLTSTSNSKSQNRGYTTSGSSNIVTLYNNYTGNNYVYSIIFDIVVGEYNPPEPDPIETKQVSISEVYSGSDGDYFEVSGIIAGFTYNYSSKANIYLVDETDSILIYPNGISISDLTVGNSLTVVGALSRYQSSTDAAYADELGYYGAVELTAASIEVDSTEVREVPSTGYTTLRIKDIVETDYRENDLSSHLFLAPATIVKDDSVIGYVNYYFYDLSMDYMVYAYSSSAGSDYAWLDSYDNQSFNVLFAVHSMRARDTVWRIVPLEVRDAVTISDEDVANFALDRLAGQVNAKYTASTSIALVSQDSKLLEQATVSYSSSSEYSLVSTDDEGNISLSIDADYLETFNLTITLVYKEVTYTKVVEITIEAPSDYGDISTIAQVLEASEGDEVTIQGIYMKFTANWGGIYIADDTGILACYYNSLDISQFIEGEQMVIKGTVVKDFSSSYYDGHNRLSDIEVLDHDSVIHQWNTDIVAGEKTTSDLYNSFDVSFVGHIYKVRGYPYINKTSRYSNWYFYPEGGGSPYLTLYCGNANQLSWLEPYSEQLHDYYIYVRDTTSKGNGRYEIVAVGE